MVVLTLYTLTFECIFSILGEFVQFFKGYTFHSKKWSKRFSPYDNNSSSNKKMMRSDKYNQVLPKDIA